MADAVQDHVELDKEIQQENLESQLDNYMLAAVVQDIIIVTVALAEQAVAEQAATIKKV